MEQHPSFPPRTQTPALIPTTLATIQQGLQTPRSTGRIRSERPFLLVIEIGGLVRCGPDRLLGSRDIERVRVRRDEIHGLGRGGDVVTRGKRTRDELVGGADGAFTRGGLTAGRGVGECGSRGRAGGGGGGGGGSRRASTSRHRRPTRCRHAGGAGGAGLVELRKVFERL